MQGLRIDHPDGLADPRGYLERLRARGVPHVWVEKILEPGEQLRDWPVEGTTGYEFANDVTALFVDPRGEEPLTQWYADLTGESRTFARIAYEAKLEQARTDFRREFDRLESLLAGVEIQRPQLEQSASSLGVYRTYVEPWSGRVEDADRAALGLVHRELRRILLLEERGFDELVTRFQQTTGPVMAKGVEDTAFYRYHRLTALNEVGGDPGRFTLAVDDFHRANEERGTRFPLHLLATQTHDTKRSGDVRARIAAIAAFADEWIALRPSWRALDDPHEDELLWQTLVGTWPIEPAPRELPGKGPAGGEAEHELDRAGPRARAAGQGGGAARDRVAAQRLRGVRRPGRGRGAADLARDDAAEAHRPGRARRLPGGRARIAQPRRPGQPPTRRLGRVPPRAGRPAAEAPGRARGARAPAAAARSASTGRSPPARTCARSCAATTSRSSCRCAPGSRRRLTCRAAAGAAARSGATRCAARARRVAARSPPACAP